MLNGSVKQKPQSNIKPIIRLVALLMVIIFACGSFIRVDVFAATQSELRERSRQLQAEIADNNAKVIEYKKQAATLQGKLNQLAAEIAGVNGQIELTNVRIAELSAELEQAQIELDRQKDLLRSSMRALYKRGGASTIELLVASDSFTQFINDQEYLERLKGAIQDSANKVIELKQQIQKQQAEQNVLLEQLKGQRETLAAKREEQRVLLEYTRGEQSRYQGAVNALRAEQAAVNAQLAPAGVDYTQTTSYPWAKYEPWSFNGCYEDPWGMCVRQCVSYTAWKVAQTGRKMPNWDGRGNANQWDDNARADGIPVDRDPRPGDIAISNGGFYGHAMYVEAVFPDGRVRVSQFNYELRGLYSEMTINQGSLVFIHFPF